MAYARLAPLGWQWTVDGVQQEKRRAAAACGSAEGKRRELAAGSLQMAAGAGRRWRGSGASCQRSEGGIRFAAKGRVRHGSVMSTVQEIEAAADLLPADKKEELLRFLAVRLQG